MRQSSYLFVAMLLGTLYAKDVGVGIYPLTNTIQKRMIEGGSYKQGCPLNFSDLRYLVVPFWGYDAKRHQGELIVHKEVALEVIEIFKVLYQKRFPIERMQLVSDFQADDEASMAANNTSAFNCRFVANTTKYSKHSFGKAIDINPKVNPCIVGEKIYPKNGIFFVNRFRDVVGMIKQESLPVSLFKSIGWVWGGEWKSLKDYQHFEKR